MFKAAILLWYPLMAVIAIVIIWQVVIPLLTDQPVWGWFHQRRRLREADKAKDDLTGARIRDEESQTIGRARQIYNKIRRREVTWKDQDTTPAADKDEDPA